MTLTEQAAKHLDVLFDLINDMEYRGHITSSDRGDLAHHLVDASLCLEAFHKECTVDDLLREEEA